MMIVALIPAPHPPSRFALMFFSNKELGNQIAPYFAIAQVCRCQG